MKQENTAPLTSERRWKRIRKASNIQNQPPSKFQQPTQ